MSFAKRLAENDELIVSLHMASSATYGQYLRTLRELKAEHADRIFTNEPVAP